MYKFLLHHLCRFASIVRPLPPPCRAEEVGLDHGRGWDATLPPIHLTL